MAALGFGTQFAPELDEQHRIVDSPVARTSSSPGSRKPIMPVRSAVGSTNGNGNSYRAAAVPAQNDPNAPASEQQLASIRKLCEHLGKSEPEKPETMSYASAKELIGQLSQEYRQSRNKAS